MYDIENHARGNQQSQSFNLLRYDDYKLSVLFISINLLKSNSHDNLKYFQHNYNRSL